MIKTLLWQMNTDTAKTLDRGTFYFLFPLCFAINFIVKIWLLLIFYICYSCRTFRKASKKADLFNAGDNIYIPTIYCEQDKDQHYIDFYPLIKRQLTRITVLRMRACGSGLRDWMIFICDTLIGSWLGFRSADDVFATCDNFFFSLLNIFPRLRLKITSSELLKPGQRRRIPRGSYFNATIWRISPLLRNLLYHSIGSSKKIC